MRIPFDAQKDLLVDLLNEEMAANLPFAVWELLPSEVNVADTLILLGMLHREGPAPRLVRFTKTGRRKAQALLKERQKAGS